MILLLGKLQLLWLSSMGQRVFHRWKSVTAVYVFFSESAGPWCLDTLCSFASDSPGTVGHCPSLILENRNIDILSPLMPTSYALRHDLFLNVELFQIYYIKNNENGSVKVTGRNQANHSLFSLLSKMPMTNENTVNTDWSSQLAGLAPQKASEGWWFFKAEAIDPRIVFYHSHFRFTPFS